MDDLIEIYLDEDELAPLGLGGTAGSNGECDPRSRSIAEKRALGLTHQEIAEIHGVSTKTVQRALNRPEVRELVDEIQSELFDESTAAVLSLLAAAVETLARMMKSESDSIALRAASKVIDSAGPLAGLRVKVRQFEKMVESVETALADL